MNEYEYNGRKFVRVIVGKKNVPVLSNGEKYFLEDAVWVEVTPITWLVDKKKNKIISERILISGFDYGKNDMSMIDYKSSNMNRFMNNNISKDIIPSKINQ